MAALPPVPREDAAERPERPVLHRLDGALASAQAHDRGGAPHRVFAVCASFLSFQRVNEPTTGRRTAPMTRRMGAIMGETISEKDLKPEPPAFSGRAL